MSIRQKPLKYSPHSLGCCRTHSRGLWRHRPWGGGIAYTCGVYLLYAKASSKNTFMILAPFGRMALTNYFTQSVIACMIYCGYGLGLFATDGPIYFTAVGIGILIFQIAFSHLWLSKFLYGPMEWLWRSLTYKKWQPIRKTEDLTINKTINA